MEQKNAATPGVVDDKCHILYLPNELLTNILERAMMSTYGRDRFEQFVKLRWVCRSFRFVVNEIAAWLFSKNDLCQFARVSLDSESSRRKEYEFFLSNLLADAHLKNAMQDKTEWCFDTLPSFEITCKHIPTLVETATRLSFRGELFVIEEQIQKTGGDILEEILTSLSKSANLMHLSLYNLPGFVPLTPIAQLPHLESLEIEVWNPEGRATYRGSLADCKTLTTLSIKEQTQVNERGVVRPPRVGLLPLGSIHSLTTLTLWLPENSSGIDDLHTFVNLKNLRIQPLDSNICKTLEAVRTFSLETFVTKLENLIEYNDVVSLFSSSCLRNIRSLRFFVDWIADTHAFLPIIAQNLRGLETLEIEFEFDYQWRDALSGLCRLRHVDWYVETDEHTIRNFESADFESDVCGELVYWYKDHEEVQACFCAKFPGNSGVTEINLRLCHDGSSFGAQFEEYEEYHDSEDDSDDVDYEEDYYGMGYYDGDGTGLEDFENHLEYILNHNEDLFL